MSDTPNVPSSDHALYVKDLRKDFGFIQALRGVDLELFKGEFLTLLGPNGAGKTTLIKILASLTKATSGGAFVAGYDVSQSDPRMRGEIGVISHVSFLYEHLSPLENLVFYAKMHGLDRPKERAVEVIDAVGLKARMNDRVGTFSRGMLQRVSIARAIINEPSVLFLDEPYTGLDQHASIKLREQLDGLHNKKRTILMTTHDIPRGLEMCDRVGVLVRGRIALMESIDQIDRQNFEQHYFEIVAQGDRQLNFR